MAPINMQLRSWAASSFDTYITGNFFLSLEWSGTQSAMLAEAEAREMQVIVHETVNFSFSHSSLYESSKPPIYEPSSFELSEMWTCITESLFQEGDRIESSQEPEPVPSVWVTAYQV